MITGKEENNCTKKRKIVQREEPEISLPKEKDNYIGNLNPKEFLREKIMLSLSRLMNFNNANF